MHLDILINMSYIFIMVHTYLPCGFFVFFLILLIGLYERERGREKRPFVVPFFMHSLVILICVPTGDQTHNFDISEQHSNQLCYPIRALLNVLKCFKLSIIGITHSLLSHSSNNGHLGSDKILFNLKTLL